MLVAKRFLLRSQRTQKWRIIRRDAVIIVEYFAEAEPLLKKNMATVEEKILNTIIKNGFPRKRVSLPYQSIYNLCKNNNTYLFDVLKNLDKKSIGYIEKENRILFFEKKPQKEDSSQSRRSNAERQSTRSQKTRPESTGRAGKKKKIYIKKEKENESFSGFLDSAYIKKFFKVPHIQIQKVSLGKKPQFAPGPLVIGILIILVGSLIRNNTIDIFFLHQYENIMMVVGALIALIPIILYAIENSKYEEQKRNEEARYNNEKKQAENVINEWVNMDGNKIDRMLQDSLSKIKKDAYSKLDLEKEDETREPCVVYGMHPECVNTELIKNVYGNVLSIDQNGRCNNRSGDNIWYFKKYEFMSIHFTADQIMIYQCDFDILNDEGDRISRISTEEWIYKHVVRIAVKKIDDFQELDRKYRHMGKNSGNLLELSSSGGDKIRIMTKSDQFNLGKSADDLTEAAVNNVRQSIRSHAAR